MSYARTHIGQTTNLCSVAFVVLFSIARLLITVPQPLCFCGWLAAVASLSQG